MKKIVVALGGNAILSKDASASSQQAAIFKTAKVLVEFIKRGYKLVITHGNGPQVGNLLLQQVAGSTVKNPAMPLDTIGAMTEGSIGYWMQQALGEILQSEGIRKTVATIITQTKVAADDPAFKNPTKPIGPFYSQEEAKKEKTENPNYIFTEDAGRGYRRVVPSPIPQEVIEYPLVAMMLKNDMIPIAAGGGGIPVSQNKDNQIVGQEAVIDKDYGAAKLAESINADELIILTAVDHVFVNFNQPNQKKLTNTTVAELKQYIAEKQFAVGSMLPKINAAIEFVEATHGKAIITSLSRVTDLLEKGVGTIVTA
ncbi:aguC protein [Liquorilactobacillus ghanensis DSM 18630]|uniref:Carbamate kinase n=1 Tax=Liquorilactobacillus ghanensis DSM 18630 TaxID=1423750 RepID=A0A0R1VMV2_9LACO|nr:carbamate kinase [Liquorilactobacillus ghanensis]KRM07066.1 aguC protein [Liquorilactobacillus ghanensis DSM 18630]